MTDSYIHQTSHMHSDQSGQRKRVRINHNIHAAAKLSQNDLCDQSPKTVMALGLSSVVDLRSRLV